MFTANRFFSSFPRSKHFGGFNRRSLAYVANDSGLFYQGATFPYGWLRDSCPCPKCVNPFTAHKIHKTSDIPPNIQPKANGIRASSDGVHIEWMNGHQSFFPIPFLDRHSSPSKLSAAHKDIPKIPWGASLLNTSNLFLQYEELRTPKGLLAAINQLIQYGLLLVREVPNAEWSDEKCELRNLAQLFGDIRKTFYGEMFDVKNVRNSDNVAYTNLNLTFHMDLMYALLCASLVCPPLTLLRYFESPPRFQILHCLRNRVSGGKSVFVDALKAAIILRKTHPEAFETLCSTPVAFHHVHADHHLHYSHPTIELASPTKSITATEESDINYINYSPPFQAPLSLLVSPHKFYPALVEFASILEKPELAFEYLLREGDAAIFDNRRVLHSRTAFEDHAEGEDGQTNRLLKGCYLEADAVLDRGRVLRAQAAY